MTLVILQVIVQSIASTLQWFGFYVGIRALPGDKSRRWRWIVGSALVFAAWLIGVALSWLRPVSFRQRGYRQR